MLSLSSPYPTLRAYRLMVARLLALAVPLAFGACGSDGSPLAPADPSPAAAEPTAAPDLLLATTGQRILFSSFRNGGHDLFKMDPLGYNVARVTSFGYYAAEPAWSADNKRIAMIRPRRDGANVEHADIYLMNADGSNKHWARSQPSSFDIRYPSWSSDGVHVVVAVFFGGKPYLATLDVTNGNMAFVLFNGKVIQGNYPSYEPAGKRILYVDATGKLIEMIDPAANTIYWMVQSQTIVSNPRLSPDGRKIAFAKLVGLNIDVYVQELWGGGVLRRLTTDPAVDGSPTWSPDGSRIAFQSDRTGTAQIWVMNGTTGGSLTRITHTATNEMSPAWSH
jgi:Periplasmic component of the Tol biopolymer transport system